MEKAEEVEGMGKEEKRKEKVKRKKGIRGRIGIRPRADVKIINLEMGRKKGKEERERERDIWGKRGKKEE